LHSRLNFLYSCDCEDCKTLQLDAKEDKQPVFKDVLKAGEKAFKHLVKNGGYKAEDITQKPYQNLINETTKVLKTAVQDNVISPVLRSALESDAFLFGSLKTHAQLFEANSLLLNSDGQIKSQAQLEHELNKLNVTYNNNHLEAERQFAVSSAISADKWSKVSERYNLQYRTVNDDKVRDEHRVLHDITLPVEDEFWKKYYPPNGWRCRCVAVQVRKSKYPESDSAKAMESGDKATMQIGKDGKNRLEIFRFNPGATLKLMPPEHPYNKVAGADKVKEASKVLEQDNEYKQLTMDNLVSLQENQNIDKLNEVKIMNNNSGYVATSNSFYLNELLRGDYALTKKDKNTIEALDSLINTNKLKENILLHRNDGFGFIEAKFGFYPGSDSASEIINKIRATGITELSDKGFYSTSAIKDNNVFKKRMVSLQIKAKKGTNAFITTNYDESEIILKRNQKFKILSIEEVNSKIKIVIKTID